MSFRRQRSSFEKTILPHLPAAYSLANWLLRGAGEADDAVQEAYLRAFRSYHQFSGNNSKAWLLTIVRNTCLTQLTKVRQNEKIIPLEAFENDSNEQ